MPMQDSVEHDGENSKVIVDPETGESICADCQLRIRLCQCPWDGFNTAKERQDFEEKLKFEKGER